MPAMRGGLATSRRAWAALAAGAAWGLGLAAPAAGAAAEAEERSFDPIPGVVTPPPAGVALRDRILTEPPVAPRARRRAETGYTAPDGSVVYVEVSDLYPPDPAADQALVDFIASLLHESELNGLRVFVAKPRELNGLCGGEALACYYPAQDRMFVVGEESFGGLPTDYVIAHEYGHHVANHRRNTILGRRALDWGTKRWASFEGACPGVLSGRFSLKLNSAKNYFRNPGEAFAEAYAQYHFPGLVGWEWVGALRPNQRSFRRIKADVLNPWRRNKTLRFARRLRQGKLLTKRIRTPLDGAMQVSLRGPRSADFDLYLLRGRRIVRRSTGRRSRESLRYTVCGEGRLTVVVDAFRGRGRAKVTVSRP